MYLFTPLNIFCYLFTLVISYFMIRGFVNMLRIGKPSGMKPVIAALLLSPLSLWIFFQLVTMTGFMVPDKYFSRSAWNISPHRRTPFAKDLIQRDLLLGKDTISVKNKLGEPWVRRIRDKDSIEWDYWMGNTSSGPSVVHNHLLLQVHRGKVLSVRHHREYD